MGLNIIMLGPPGAGKGTQAERFARTQGVPKISTGEILREAVSDDTPLGRLAKATMAEGRLVGDDVMIGIVRERLLQPDAQRGFVLDGFPRTVAQAEALGDIDAAVLIDVPDDVVVERILARGQGRADDNPETVRERLRVYHRLTEPLAEYYERQGKLRRVDGAGTPDEVHRDVLRGLGHGPA